MRVKKALLVMHSAFAFLPLVSTHEGMRSRVRFLRQGTIERALQRSAQENRGSSEELLALFEGDIDPDYGHILDAYGPDVAQQLVDEGLLATNKQVDVNGSWSTRINDVAVIPYQIDESYFNAQDQATIIYAIEDIAYRSKVVAFVPRSSQANYIHVVSSAGCSSFVGMQGIGPQKLKLNSPGCVSVGIIQHEFLHALGFWHEQSRQDRDDYIAINWENIEDGKQRNFMTITSPTLGSKYDYDSLMHYGSDYFSSNGKDTIASFGKAIGQRYSASIEDIRQLQLLYQCTSGSRTAAQAESTPCSLDCKCWHGAIGCGSDSDVCQNGLTCVDDKCLDPNAPTGPVRPTSSGDAPSTLCFSENNYVQVRGKGSIPIGDLRVGDFVKSCDDGEFSKVYSFFHKHTDMASSYIRITTTNGSALEISSDHMIHANGAVVRASEVREGDLLPGSGFAESVQVVLRRGVYAPITKIGHLDVSGVCVSSYVALWDYIPWIQNIATHVSMSIFRMGCELFSCQNETYDEGTGISTKYRIGVVSIAQFKALGLVAQLAVTVAGAPLVLVVFVFENTVFKHPFSSVAAMCGYFTFISNRFSLLSQ